MPASIGVNLRVTGHCSQGGRKYMEDLFSVAYQQTEDEKDLEYAFFGIYDGHGGREAAAFAKEHLMDAIVKQRQFWSDNDEDVLKAIRNGYMLTHLNMWKELDKWPKTVTGLPSTAGTTASIAFIRKGKIYIGHVGDSAIVLGYQKEGCEDWLARPLTLDHKPESATEIERIHQSGGKVVSKAGVPRVVWNRPRPGHRGPMNKNTPVDEIPFLAVARSLGDLWSYNLQNDEFIVSPDPDVGVLTIDPSKFRCLIFGTDGLWNMVSAEAAVGLVQATEQHNEAAVVASTDAAAGAQPRDWLNPSKSLVDNALERWSNTRMRADNTSVVTLMLDPPGPPRAAVLRSRAPRLTPVTPPRPSECQEQDKKTLTTESPATEVPCSTDKESNSPVPQNGLAIVTRYPENEAPPPPPRTPVLAPLPPCASLDGRFSTAANGCLVDNYSGQPDQDEEEEEHEAMTNYGNPSESFFISRLLNRTNVCNSLSNVYDEIIYGPPVETVLEEAQPSADATEQKDPVIVQDAAQDDTATPFVAIGKRMPVTDQTVHMEKLTIRDKVTVCSSSGAPGDGIGYDFPTDAEEDQAESDAVSVPSSPDESEESIQINEVSSSSPIDVPPKPKGRRPKAQAKNNFQAQLPHGRSLRSHDTCNLHRPQTRFTAHRTRPVPLPCPDRSFDTKMPVAIPRNINNNVDNADRNAPASTGRVVILNRVRCEPVAPAARPPPPPTRSESLIRTSKLGARVPKMMGAEPKVAARSNAPEKPDSRRPAPPPRIPEGAPRSVQASVRITRSRDGVTECEPRRRHPPPEPPEAYVRSTRPDEAARVAIRTRPVTAVPPVEARFTSRPFPAASPSKMLDGPPECSKENFIGRPSTAGRPSGFTEGGGRGKRRGGAVSPAHLQPSEKRRTRLDDKRTAALHDAGYLLALNIASAGMHAALPLNRRHRNRTSGKPERQSVPEVHSTTSSETRENGDGVLETDNPATPLRTLRSRNDCHPSAGEGAEEAMASETGKTGSRRALRSSDNLHPEELPQGKGTGVVGTRQVLRSRNEAAAESQRVTRSSRLPAALSMAKRLTGRANWPPALTTRNRLRKRHSK